MKQEDGIVILALPHFIVTFKWMPAVPRRSVVVLAYTPTFEKLIPHLTRTGVSNQVILAFRAELLHFAAPKGGCSVNSGDQEHFGPSLGRAAGGWPVPFRDPDSSLFVNDPGVVLVILSEARILFHAGIVVIFSSSDLALDLRHGNEGNHEDEHSGILRAAALA